MPKGAEGEGWHMQMSAGSLPQHTGGGSAPDVVWQNTSVQALRPGQCRRA